jgi:3-hydroxybutyrate dehydrogenase
MTTTHKVRDLEGKVAIVTGATSGIGLAIAKELIERGAHVTLNGIFFDITRVNPETGEKEIVKSKEIQEQEFRDKVLGPLQQQASAIYPYTQQVKLCIANVSELDDAQKAVGAQKIVNMAAEHGKIDILVNNAGMQVPKPIDQVNPDEWKRLIDVNLNGAFYLTHAVVPHMRAAGGGNIINMASVHAHVVSPGRGPYCASKFGLRALTETCAIDLAKDNIAVNTVSPAFVKTPLAQIQIDQMVAQGKTLEEAEAWRLQLQEGKWIGLEDLATATADIAARKADLKTGEDLLLDNGYVERARAQTADLSKTGIAFFDPVSRAALEGMHGHASSPNDHDEAARNARMQAEIQFGEGGAGALQPSVGSITAQVPEPEIDPNDAELQFMMAQWQRKMGSIA